MDIYRDSIFQDVTDWVILAIRYVSMGVVV